ncbi:MAG TPA: MFS transporter [Candidatus Binatia bacterium]|nr:MFS transporter [Candidatus Binatia bacterium]
MSETELRGEVATARAERLTQLEKYQTLALLSGGHGVAHWYNGVLSVLYPALTAALGLSYSQVGLFDSSRGVVAVIASLTGGYLADVFGRKRLMLALALVSLGVAFFFLSFAQTFAIALLWLAIGGIGNSLWHPYAMPILGALFPRRKSMALAFHDAAANFFHGLSPIVVGFLFSLWTWDRVVRLHLWPGLLLGGLLLLIVPRVELARGERSNEVSYRQALRSGLLRNREFVLAGAVSIGLTVGRLGLFTFLPLFLAFELGLDSTLQGLHMGVLTFSGALAAPVVGVLADRVGVRLVLMVATLLATILIFSLSLARAGLALLVIIGLIGATLFSVRSLIMVYVISAVPTELGGSSVGVIFSLNRLFGILSPIVAGIIGDLYGLRAVFLFLGSLTFIGMLLTLTLRQGQGGKDATS